MKLKKAFSLLLAGIPLFLSAQEIPLELQQEILAEHPELDSNRDGEISITEFKRGRKSFSPAFRGKMNNALAGTLEADKTKEIESLLSGLGLRGELGVEYKTSVQGRTLLDIVYPNKKVYEKGASGFVGGFFIGRDPSEARRGGIACRS